MERVLIIGCPGSGKSTLARELAKKTGLPIVHLDKLRWRPFWQTAPQEEFDVALAEETEKDRWIIDGNYRRTLESRLQRADTVFFLDYSRWVCLSGWFVRMLSPKARKRPDMPENCREKPEKEFFCYIWNFRKKSAPGLYEVLSRHPDKTVYVLKNRRQAKKLLEKL